MTERCFYGKLVYKFRKIVGKLEISDHFIKLSYKREGHITDFIKRSASLAVNPIAVDHFAYFFNCTPVGRDSESMMALT